MFKRSVEDILKEALSISPAVLLAGARQVGKSTLCMTLDEIQKVPELLEGIKIEIDNQRINGSFLLTGSANVLDMKKAKETLVGRIIEIPMWPLSQKELHKF